jgi:signal transduction histidine kinase
MASHLIQGSAPVPTRRELLPDAAIAVVAFAGSIGLLAAGGANGDGSGIDALGVLLTALASLPLVARRFAPLGVFVSTAVASAVLYGVADVAGPPIGPTVALFTLAAAGDGSRARGLFTLAVAATLLAVHVTASGLAHDRFPGAELLFGVLLWGGTWLAGDRARLRRERMAELEERALRAERDAERERRLAAAEERARIARDLHDSAGHAINVILVHAGLGRLRTEHGPEEARAAFETIEEVARETVGEIDQLVGVLREDSTSIEGVNGVEPPPGLAALEALLQRHRDSGLDVTATVAGERRALSPGVDRAAYRILQDALTNAARHGAGAARVEVAFGPSALDLTVANPVLDGRAARPAGGGHGVIGMSERAAALGGSLEAGVRDGRFEVHARLPFAGSAA